MKFKDLTKEQQEHFLEVVEYCKENGLEEQLEEATHIDFRVLEVSLTKFIDEEEFYYDIDEWEYNSYYKSNLYQKPEDYKYLLENQNESETMYKLKIIYKNNPETLTLNFKEDQKDNVKELFSLIKDHLISLRKGGIGHSIISSDLAFVIDVNEVASVFLSEE